MNDKKEVNLQKEFKNIKIKGQDKKSYTITITDEKIDLKDKKDGDEVKINAKIKEDKDSGDKTITLKGKFNSGLYRDSISVKETEDATLKELESEIKPYSKIWTKPMTIGTIVVVLLLVIGGIWWWISSSKSEDKEEESL